MSGWSGGGVVIVKSVTIRSEFERIGKQVGKSIILFLSFAYYW